MDSAAERLSRFAWGSKDGGDHEETDQGPSDTQQNGADHSPTASSKVSLLPRRIRGLRRGFSLDRLPQTDLGDVTLAGGMGSPP